MNKTIAVVVGVVAIAGVAYAGGTYLTGQQVQKRYQEQLAKLPVTAPFLRVKSNVYEKGFATSTSTTTVEFGCSAVKGQPDGSKTLVFKDTIHHGPFASGLNAAAIDSEIVLPADAQASVAQMFGAGVKPFTIHTTVGYGGSFNTTVKSPAGKATGPDGEQIAWQGLDLVASGDSGMKTVSNDLTVPGLQITDAKNGVAFEIGGLKWAASGTAVSDLGLLRVGKGQGTLASFKVDVSANAARPGLQPVSFALRDLVFSSDATADKGLVNGEFKLKGNGTAGATKIDGIELAASARRIHAQTYEKMTQAVWQASADCAGASTPDANATAMMARMQEQLGALLVHNPEIALDKLAVDFGGKRGELSYSMGVQGVTPEDAKLEPAALFLSRGVGQGAVRLPVAWLTQIAQQMPGQNSAANAPLMVEAMLASEPAQRFVVRDGEFVQSSMRFEKGALQINGKSFPQ